MSEDLVFLSRDIHDVDGHRIAPAGAMVGKSLLDAIAGGGASETWVALSDTDIPAELDNVFQEEDLPPFFGNEFEKRLSRLVSRIECPDPARRELDLLRNDLPILFHHSLATTCISLRLCLEVTAKAEDLIKIGRANLFKDIGMTRIPREITRNRDYLTRREYTEIARHPALGLLLNTYYFGEGLEGMVALRHHMRNGAGYPTWAGLKPSKLVDIIETVDIFYALISPRPFRPDPYDVRGAFDQMTQMVQSGELSEEALKLLVSCYRSDKPLMQQVSLSDEQLGFIPETNFYGMGPRES